MHIDIHIRHNRQAQGICCFKSAWNLWVCQLYLFTPILLVRCHLLVVFLRVSSSPVCLIMPCADELLLLTSDHEHADALHPTIVTLQGVLYTHRTCYIYAMLKCAPDNMSLSCNSCIYAMVPMYHATAWGVPFCAPMVGARLVLPGQYPCTLTVCRVVNCKVV